MAKFSQNAFQNHMRIKANRWMPTVMYLGIDYCVFEFDEERTVVELLCDFEDNATNYGYALSGHEKFFMCSNAGLRKEAV
jgi:hypothetical protein